MNVVSKVLGVKLSGEVIKVSNDFEIVVDIELSISKDKNNKTFIEYHSHNITSGTFMAIPLGFIDGYGKFKHSHVNDLFEILGKLSIDVDAIISESIMNFIRITHREELLALYPNI